MINTKTIQVPKFDPKVWCPCFDLAPEPFKSEIRLDSYDDYLDKYYPTRLKSRRAEEHLFTPRAIRPFKPLTQPISAPPRTDFALLASKLKEIKKDH